MSLRYFYDKSGRYIGATTEPETPEGAAGWAEFGPAHAGQVWNGEEWEEPRALRGFARMRAWWNR